MNTFTYLGANNTSNLSLNKEIITRTGKASATMVRLRKWVWENRKLTLATKICIYRACILSTLLHSSETWTTYARHEARLNSFHLHCLRHILGNTWKDKISNTKVLQQTRTPSMHNLLMQCCMHWLGHVRHMGDGRIPKDILYGELITGSQPNYAKYNYSHNQSKCSTMPSATIVTWCVFGSKIDSRRCFPLFIIL